MADEKKNDSPKPASTERPKGEPRDVGYGPSHGNEPGHEGPSGPGDAPAK